MPDSVDDLFRQRLDGYIDQWADEIGYARVEVILQERAQDMRERADADDSVEVIGLDDIEGYGEDA